MLLSRVHGQSEATRHQTEYVGRGKLHNPGKAREQQNASAAEPVSCQPAQPACLLLHPDNWAE